MNSPLLTIRKLNVSYANAGIIREVLRDLDLVLHRGDWLMLKGENGAGKSTLIKAIARTIPVKSGKVEFATELKQTSSPLYVLQQNPLVSCPTTLTVGEALWAADDHPPTNRTLAWQRYQNLLRSSASQISPDAPITTLSGGERQIVGLVMTAVRSVGILLLDEPTGALDATNEVHCLETLRLLASASTTILHITHNPRHFAGLGNRRAELRDGTIIEL